MVWWLVSFPFQQNKPINWVLPMPTKPTYEELEQRIKQLEKRDELRNQAEEDFRKTRDILENRLTERTRELEILSTKLLNAQEEERKRIAGDLHDVIGQSLAAAKFMVETALEQMKGKCPPSGLNTLKTLVPMLQKASGEVRTIVMNLRPSMLDNLGILSTINWFCRQYRAVYSNIQIEKQINISESEIPDTLKTILFRILQEAMNNIAKHSKASTVSVCLEKRDQTVHLIIKDDGGGFDAKAPRKNGASGNGFGITSMKERAELSGGSFEIKATPGEGTTVRASWLYKSIKAI